METTLQNNSTNPNSLENNQPLNIITDAEAATMRALFINNQYQFINAGLAQNSIDAPKDKSHITFELADLKRYIALLEQVATQENYTNLGLRIYYAAKPDDNGFPQMSIFMRGVGVDSNENAPEVMALNTMLAIPNSVAYNKGYAGGNGK